MNFLNPARGQGFLFVCTEKCMDSLLPVPVNLLCACPSFLYNRESSVSTGSVHTYAIPGQLEEYMPEWFWMILIQIVLILLNAVFAGSEIAMLSVSELHLKRLEEKGNSKAGRLLKLLKDPARFLSAIQIAITLSGFLGSAFAADSFSGIAADWMVSLGIPLPYQTLDTIAVILITLILSYFTLVFGELVPKQIAMHKSEQMALGAAGLLNAIAVLFSPLVKVLTWSSNGVLRLLGIQPGQEEEAAGEEEILMMAQAGAKQGTIDAEEEEMIASVFAFDDLLVRDLLTHRTEMVFLDLEEDNPGLWRQTILDTSHTLIPVCQGSADTVLGILDTRKYFRSCAAGEKEKIEKAMLEPWFVWESMKADVLFKAMKQKKETMAIVLDEYGGVSGLITLTDLIESLVGSLQEENGIEPLCEGCWRVPGTLGVQELSRLLGIEIDPRHASLHGLVCDLLQGLPENASGKKVSFHDYQIELESVCRHRLVSAVIRRDAPALQTA